MSGASRIVLYAMGSYEVCLRLSMTVRSNAQVLDAGNAKPENASKNAAYLDSGAVQKAAALI